MSTHEERLQNLFEALADHVESLSDDDLLRECREDGDDPEVLAAHTRAVLRRAIERWQATQGKGAMGVGDQHSLQATSGPDTAPNPDRKSPRRLTS